MRCEYLLASELFQFIHLLRRFGYTWMTTIEQPGQMHSAMRRIYKETLGIQPVVKYDPFIQQQAQKLVAELNGFEGAPLGNLQRWDYFSLVQGNKLIDIVQNYRRDCDYDSLWSDRVRKQRTRTDRS
jgi:hypothetical protein